MAYYHARVFWGAFDLTYNTPEYDTASTHSGGTSAAAGSGVGVRRVELIFDRDPPGTVTDDVAEVHFDFMNLTGGHPDDTWTTTDFTTLETAILNWHAAIQSVLTSGQTFREMRWYRVGTGVAPPNPAARVTPVGASGSSASAAMPPQCAISITQKTARRKQWGRIYVPGCTEAAVGAQGSINPTVVDQFGLATHNLGTAAAGHEFYMGVLSKVAGSFFTTEHVQVDDVWDVIRSRRWRNATHKYISP